MGDVVDLVQLEEVRGDDPGAVLDDLVNPLAMADGLGALAAGKHRQTLALVGVDVAGYTDDEVDVGEGLLCLFELAHVAVEVSTLASRSVGRAREAAVKFCSCQRSES